jgi:hypothetical protein
MGRLILIFLLLTADKHYSSLYLDDAKRQDRSTMKDLRESPTGFHIMLEHAPVSEGVAVVSYCLGELNDGVFAVTADEARTIAAWFAGLATEIEASEVSDASA